MRAFPTNKTLLMQDDNEKLYVQSFENLGMDLRDYFAAQAMQGLIQIVKGCELGRDGSTITPDSIRLSNVAYGVADAMMKARETNGE